MRWNKVNREDVIKAINEFDNNIIEYTRPRTTYLVYQGKIYPAKQIRRMGYKNVYGYNPKEHEIYGGRPTIKFLEKRGFETYWKTRDKENIEYEQQINEMRRNR